MTTSPSSDDLLAMWEAALDRLAGRQFRDGLAEPPADDPNESTPLPDHPDEAGLLDPHDWVCFFVRLGPEVVESFDVVATRERDDGYAPKTNTTSVSVTFRDPSPGNTFNVRQTGT